MLKTKMSSEIFELTSTWLYNKFTQLLRHIKNKREAFARFLKFKSNLWSVYYIGLSRFLPKKFIMWFLGYNKTFILVDAGSQKDIKLFFKKFVHTHCSTHKTCFTLYFPILCLGYLKLKLRNPFNIQEFIECSILKKRMTSFCFKHLQWSL